MRGTVNDEWRMVNAKSRAVKAQREKQCNIVSVTGAARTPSAVYDRCNREQYQEGASDFPVGRANQDGA
jgi:hypothetical protein